MISYAAGSRYLSLLGGTLLSFYNWYCDLPLSSPQMWGEQTDVPESADWYNAGFLMVWGSNISMTRAPGAHFYAEARYRGIKAVVVAPDYNEAAKFTWACLFFWSAISSGCLPRLPCLMRLVSPTKPNNSWR